MNNFDKFSQIANADIIFEIESINKANKESYMVKVLFSLNILIIILYLFDAFISTKIVGEFNVNPIFVFEFLFLIGIILPFFIFNNGKSMKLIFTSAGVALCPCLRLFKIPINCVAEKWENIESYSFFQLPKLMKIGSDPSKKWVLNIRTSGILQKFVNNYGISVFAISGHHMNEKEREIVIGIFQSFNIRQEIDSV
jgi:hypothetical protein